MLNKHSRVFDAATIPMKRCQMSRLDEEFLEIMKVRVHVWERDNDAYLSDLIKHKSCQQTFIINIPITKCSAAYSSVK